MVDVCLVVAPDPSNTERWLAPECLGIGSIAAYLKSKGKRVRIVDGFIRRLSTGEAARRAVLSKPRVIAIQLMSPWTSHVVADVVEEIRSAGFDGLVGLGGAYASLDYDFLLDEFPGLDFIVVGDGERPLLALLDEPDALKVADGLASRVRTTPVRGSRAKSLCDAPAPLRPYAKPLTAAGIPLSIYMSRGCFRKCDFCAVVPFSELGDAPPWRTRAPEDVVNEIIHLRDRYGADQFIFVDDNFVGPAPVDKARVRRFANLINETCTKITFAIETHPRDIETVLVQDLIEAGLGFVAIGFESGSSTQLRRMKKASNAEVNHRACEILANHGVPTYLNSIILDQGSSFEEVEDTIEALSRYTADHTFNIISHAEARIGSRLQRRVKPEPSQIEDRRRPEYTFADPKIDQLSKVLLKSTGGLFILTQDIWRLLWIEWRTLQQTKGTPTRTDVQDSPVRSVLKEKNKETIAIARSIVDATRTGLDNHALLELQLTTEHRIERFRQTIAAKIHLAYIYIDYIARSSGKESQLGKFLHRETSRRFDVVQRRETMLPS